MASFLHNDIISYFKLLKEVEETWKVLSQKAEKRLKALVDQTEQYRLVSTEVEGADKHIDKETRERLIYKIRMSIEIELRFLLDYLIQLRFANRGLKNALDGLEFSRNYVSMKDEMIEEYMKGTSYAPKLNDLLQWAMEGQQFYDNLCLRIDDSLKVVDYKVQETIDKLVSSFGEDKRARKNLNMIFSFTQLMIDDDNAMKKEQNERRMMYHRAMEDFLQFSGGKKCDE